VSAGERNPVAVAFGERFRAARLARNLTQREVAQRLDVRENDVRRWETGRNLPTAHRLPAIRRVLWVTLDHLFGVTKG
jgi:transcriptional regulator with XRE-family HTH domain